MNNKGITSSLVAVLAAALIFSACGEPSTTPGSSPTTNPDGPVTSGPDDQSPQPAGSPSITDPQAGQLDLHPIGWDHYKLAKDDRTLSIVFWSGVEPCYVLDHVDVDYGAKKITVTLFEGHSPSDEDVACIDIAVEKTTVIDLDEAVDGRKVVDGAP